jgi:hypothetical protein
MLEYFVLETFQNTKNQENVISLIPIQPSKLFDGIEKYICTKTNKNKDFANILNILKLANEF